MASDLQFDKLHQSKTFLPENIKSVRSYLINRGLKLCFDIKNFAPYDTPGRKQFSLGFSPSDLRRNISDPLMTVVILLRRT